MLSDTSVWGKLYFVRKTLLIKQNILKTILKMIVEQPGQFLPKRLLLLLLKTDNFTCYQSLKQFLFSLQTVFDTAINLRNLINQEVFVTLTNSIFWNISTEVITKKEAVQNEALANRACNEKALYSITFHQQAALAAQIHPWLPEQHTCRSSNKCETE